jgi:hypothetical protein
MTTITSSEQQLLQNVRAKADELAKLLQEANASGFNVTFNINGAIGACDRFDVFKMVPVDMKMEAN